MSTIDEYGMEEGCALVNEIENKKGDVHWEGIEKGDVYVKVIEKCEVEKDAH